MRRWTWRLVFCVTTGAMAAGASLVWAWRPAPARAGPPRLIDLPESPAASPEPASGSAPFDVAAFDRVLWSPLADSPERAATAAPAAETPVPLELIGILREAGRPRAILYEPRADRLHIAAAGARVGGHSVQAVTADGVELSDGRRVRVLRLERGPGGAS